MRTFLTGVAAVALMGGTALAQNVVLVPQGQGPTGQQQFILVPVPQDDGAQQQQQQRADAMALDFYRRGYQRGVADAQNRGGTVDPSAMEQIGRELFERGYMLGVMQAHARATAQEMPDFSEQSQSGEKQGSQQSADASGQSRTGSSPQPGVDLSIAGRMSGDEASEVLDGQSAGPSGADLSIAGRMSGDQASEVFDGNASGPVVSDGTQQQAPSDLGVQGQLPAGEGASGQAPGRQVTPEQIARAARDGSSDQAGTTGGSPQASGAIRGQDSGGLEDRAAQGGSASAQAQAGAQGQNAEQAATSAGQSPQAIIRTVENDQHGEYLVDANGRPVYLLEADRQGGDSTQPSSECRGACAEAWPPVLTQQAPPRALGDADEGMLSMMERQDGTQQVTYNGWPLYYYAEDEDQVTEGSDARPTGHDVHDQWGGWYLLTPEGEQVGHD